VSDDSEVESGSAQWGDWAEVPPRVKIEPLTPMTTYEYRIRYREPEPWNPTLWQRFDLWWWTVRQKIATWIAR